MSFLYRPCRMEMDHEAYANFLIEHQQELNLPYPFAIKLSFLSSPLLFGQGLLIFEEESFEVIGAAGFVCGTGANNYEDRHICQVEVAYLLPVYRRTPLFARSLHAFVTLMKEEEPGVDQVQFWASTGETEYRRLFSKFLALPEASTLQEGSLTCYRIPFSALEAYSQRLRQGRVESPAVRPI